MIALGPLQSKPLWNPSNCLIGSEFSNALTALEIGENINSRCGINLPILEARFTKKGNGIVYAYCNKDGLIKNMYN